MERLCGDAKVPPSLLDRFKTLSSRTGGAAVPQPAADDTCRAGDVDEEDEESTDVALDCPSPPSPSPKAAPAAAVGGGGGRGASDDDGLVCGGGSAMRLLRSQESGPRRRGVRRPQTTAVIGVRQARRMRWRLRVSVSVSVSVLTCAPKHTNKQTNNTERRQHLLSLLDAVHATLLRTRTPRVPKDDSLHRRRFIYTCRLDVAPDSLEPLLTHLAHLVPRKWQRRGTHVTLVYALLDGLRRRAVRRGRCPQPEGACHSLRATHVGWTAHVVSLRLEHVAEEGGGGVAAAVPPVRTDGEPLHLTLAVEPRHGKAKFSNNITQWTPLPEELSGVRLSGVVAHERILRKRVARHARRRGRRRAARVRGFVTLQRRSPPTPPKRSEKQPQAPVEGEQGETK